MLGPAIPCVRTYGAIPCACASVPVLPCVAILSVVLVACGADPCPCLSVTILCACMPCMRCVPVVPIPACGACGACRVSVSVSCVVYPCSCVSIRGVMRVSVLSDAPCEGGGSFILFLLLSECVFLVGFGVMGRDLREGISFFGFFLFR